MFYIGVELFFLLSYLFTNTNCDTIITLPSGQIRGRELITDNNVTFYAFQEVPYAAPPLGNLRFRDPVNVQNWDGVLNTTNNTKICLQWGLDSDLENEDCLYLNVYTPIKPGTQGDLPVLVFVHGGAFIMGTSIYIAMGPEFFIDYEIIVITINYRLGPFGFLSTQDTTIPGNYGLKDINFALKWVQKNVHLFGGDPEKVVIQGQSSGAASVGSQIISKQSKGLFRGAIMESGSAICSWAYQRYSREIAYELAQAINPNITYNNTTEELLTLLQSVPAAHIKNAKIQGPSGLQLGQGDIFAPVIELEHENAFITDLMHESLRNGDINKIPIIIGINSEEKIYDANDLEGLKYRMTEFDKNITLIVNEDYRIDSDKKVEAGNSIRLLYVQDKFQDNLGSAISFSSDVRYTTSVLRHAYLQSNHTEVYTYQFSYHGKMGHNDICIEGAERVGHAEELNYIWRNWQNSDLSIYPPEDILTQKRLLTMWTNFIKFLNPTPEKCDLLQNVTWPTVSQNKFQYLNINDTLEVKENPKKYFMWSSVIDRLGNPPFDTY